MLTGYPQDGLTIFVLDTVTGRLLHSQHHSQCYGPVSSAFFDNRVVLQFWEEASSRWQITVLELYDHSASQPTLSNLVLGALVCVHLNISEQHSAGLIELMKSTTPSLCRNIGWPFDHCGGAYILLSIVARSVEAEFLRQICCSYYDAD